MMVASSDRRRLFSSDCHAVLAVNGGEQSLDKYQKVSQSSCPDCGACRLPLRGIRQPIFTTSGEDRHVRNALQAPRGIAAGNYAWRAIAPPAADAAGGLRHSGCGRMRGRSHPAFGRQERSGQGSTGAGRQRLHGHARRSCLHSQADQDRRAPFARVRGHSRCRDAAQPRSDRRPRVLPVARRPECQPDPGPAHELRPAHGRRILQQPVCGP